MKDIDECIEWFSNHPFHKKIFCKLKESDINEIKNFFNRGFKDKNEAAHFGNRLFLDTPKDKRPKNWCLIHEVVASIISHRYP